MTRQPRGCRGGSSEMLGLWRLSQYQVKCPHPSQLSSSGTTLHLPNNRFSSASSCSRNVCEGQIISRQRATCRKALRRCHLFRCMTVQMVNVAEREMPTLQWMSTLPPARWAAVTNLTASAKNGCIFAWSSSGMGTSKYSTPSFLTYSTKTLLALMTCVMPRSESTLGFCESLKLPRNSSPSMISFGYESPISVGSEKFSSVQFKNGYRC
mmetsp:Transcript_7051/g.15641  ORF Transcript_7051/g.15641 Transcript_7051/m.15641 type:complete len:210 (+) Transcript_7051:470-1099(+)